jgi:hypothetical protein
MPEKCDGYLFRCHSESLCLLLLQLQCSLDLGCSLLLYEDQLWISKHLPVARVSLPGAHRCMAVEYFTRLSLFTYRCQSRYGFSSSYTTCANALRLPDKLPLTTRLFHHRLAVGCAEFDCCSLAVSWGASRSADCGGLGFGIHFVRAIRLCLRRALNGRVWCNVRC